MTWLLVFVVVIVVVLIYLLFAPIYLEVDTERSLYLIRFHRLLSARLSVQESLFVELRITWWHKSFDLFAARVERKKPQPENRKGKKVVSFQKVWAVIKTFKVRRCEVNIDSGDDFFNGIFFPWMMLLGLHFRRNISMNFLGENKMVLEIKNNTARMLWAFLTN